MGNFLFHTHAHTYRHTDTHTHKHTRGERLPVLVAHSSKTLLKKVKKKKISHVTRKKKKLREWRVKVKRESIIFF